MESLSSFHPLSCSMEWKDQHHSHQSSQNRCSSIPERQNPHQNPPFHTPDHFSVNPLSTPSRKSPVSTRLSSACSPAPPANHDVKSEELLGHDGFFPNVFPR